MWSALQVALSAVAEAQKLQAAAQEALRSAQGEGVAASKKRLASLQAAIMTEQRALEQGTSSITFKARGQGDAVRGTEKEGAISQSMGAGHMAEAGERLSSSSASS